MLSSILSTPHSASFRCSIVQSLALSLAASAWLPVLSQAAELVEADVFISGSEGYHTFRIPSLIVTKSGTLLAICEGRKTGRGDHGDLDLVQKRSTDGGKTWGPLELIYEEGGTERVTIGNPCPVVDQDTGILWLPFNRDNDKVLITSSTDDGRTWTKPRDITVDTKASDWSWYAAGPGNGIQLTRSKYKGRLVIPCDHRVGGNVQDKNGWNLQGRSHVIYSDDQGKSWKLGGSTDYGMNECAVVELTDGSLLLNSRSYRGKSCRGVSISRDGGQTWEPTRDDPTLVESVCQASLIRYSWKNESNAGVLIFSNPAVPTGRTHLTIRLSEDDSQTWPNSRLLSEGSSAYSCLARLPNGEIGCLYERDNYKRLVLARFTPDWVREK